MMIDTLTLSGGMDREKPEILFASLQKLLDFSADMIFVKDMALTYVAGTQSFAEMVGKPSMSEVLGRTDYELFVDKELSKRFTADDRKLLDGGKDLLDYVEPITEENGEARYSRTSKYILTGQDGAQIGLLGVSRDITKEMRAHQQYQQEIEYLFTLPEDTYTAILVDVTDWRIIGQRNQQSMRRKIALLDTMESFLWLLRDGICDTQNEACAFYQAFSQINLSTLYAQGKNDFDFEYERRFSDDDTCWVRDEWRLMSDPETGHLTAMLLVKDINSARRSVEKLAQAAATDPLTGILNRAAVQTQTQAYLEGDGADGSHAVFMIDVDDFKQVNDTYGHQAGDQLLIQLANGIRSCFRESDVVGRIGGDEFFVFARNLPDHDVIRSKAERLLETVRTIYATNTMAIGSVSIGVSTYPADGRTLDELYEKADAALYKAKNMGKNRFAFPSDEQRTGWSSNALAKRYEAYNSQVIDHSGSPCYISDMETYELLHITKGGMSLYGMTRPEEYLGRKCHEVIMGLDEPCPFCTNCKLTEGMEYRWERYNENIDRWFDRTSSIIHLDGRRCHLEIGRDITARKKEISLLSGKLSMEDVLFRCLRILTSEKDMDTALDLFLEAVGGYHQADRAYILEIDWSSRTADCTFEWHSQASPPMREAMAGTPMDRIWGWYEKFETEGEHAVTDMAQELGVDEAVRRNMMAAGVRSALMAPLRRDGEIVGILGVDNPRQKEGNLTLLRSVSEFVQAELERRRLVKELEHMSFTDTLTGLRNRNQYVRVLREYDRRTPESLGVVIVDINGLKVINDTHGQSFGDHIVRRVGSLISENISGMVFRTGGGEFTALCEDVTRDAFQQEAIAMRVAFEGDRDYSVSIGCAWSDDEDETVPNLLRQTEELLRADKRSYYHTVLREGRCSGSAASVSDEVVKEVEDGRFVVYYQPQVDIKTGKIIGAEALVRKRDEDGGLIPPNRFIPFYEMEGVVGLVDMFVLDAACATIRQWMDQGYTLSLSVNFSRVTLLEPEIVDRMRDICQKHDVPTSAITVEVTESISKMDQEQLKELIRTINKAGFTISLDDFGSQYSNLAILSAMDFDEIKFDKSLVKALEYNRKSRVVMENSVKMCHDLDGTSSLAEGIETKGQLDLLMDYRCDYGQGYYFSRPIPPEEFQSLLENSREDTHFEQQEEALD